MKKSISFCLLLSICWTAYAQLPTTRLLDVFPPEAPPANPAAGDFSFVTDYRPSGSYWELDWSEEAVFHALMKYTDAQVPQRSFELRIGRGGQIYSFQSDFTGDGLLDEALPPQWRNSFDETGSAVSSSLPGVVDGRVLPERGNWAPWVDEVWQLVASDQNDRTTEADGTQRVKTRNIHQAGSYMNNFTHRASDHDETPFYSPIVAARYDSLEQAYSLVAWGQSENPDYVYDGVSDCDPCFGDPFRASLMYYLKYKNLGDGIIQVDYHINNFHPTRKIGYFNVPFAGIRHSLLPYIFTGASNGTYSGTELRSWAEGDARNVRNTGGWFAFSTQPDGEGPGLAFVTTNDDDGYGDLRYGTALGPDEVRDVTIFSRRAIPGPSDYWNLVGGESIRGRYFIVVGESLSAIAARIVAEGLVAAGRNERFQRQESELDELYYTVESAADQSVELKVATAATADLTFKSQPFVGGRPVFLIETAASARITTDPYYYSLRPYDGTVERWRLIGYAAAAVDIDPFTYFVEEPPTEFTLYPNPSRSLLYVQSPESLDTIEVFDLTGRKLGVRVQESSNEGRSLILDIGGLPAGAYLMKAEGVNRIFIKQ